MIVSVVLLCPTSTFDHLSGAGRISFWQTIRSTVSSMIHKASRILRWWTDGMIRVMTLLGEPFYLNIIDGKWYKEKPLFRLFGCKIAKPQTISGWFQKWTAWILKWGGWEKRPAKLETWLIHAMYWFNVKTWQFAHENNAPIRDILTSFFLKWEASFGRPYWN